MHTGLQDLFIFVGIDEYKQTNKNNKYLKIALSLLALVFKESQSVGILNTVLFNQNTCKKNKRLKLKWLK